MITEKQFIDAFTAAGGWFFLTQFETIKNWHGNTSDLVDLLYEKGFDKNRTGTNARVSGSKRIIENDMGRKALEKIEESNMINKAHPEASKLAHELIVKYYSK